MSKSYKLIIEDRRNLQTVVSRPFARWQPIVIVVAAVAVIFALSWVLLAFTPLNALLPARMEGEQRVATIDELRRVDSLQNQVDANQAYLQNLITVMDTDRKPTDSVRYSSVAVEHIGDTLMTSSKVEKEFISMMDKRERYNLSILAPMAAEGMVFSDINPSAIYTTDTHEARTAKVVVPRGEPLSAISDGIIVDTHYVAGQGYCVIIQHAGGFLTRYDRLGRPLVEAGDAVTAGEAIAHAQTGTGVNGNVIYLRMWRNGESLIPYAIIKSRIASSQHSGSTAGSP